MNFANSPTEVLNSSQPQIEIESELTHPRILRKGFKFYRNSTFLSLMLGYGAYYLCRQNMGVAFIPMKQNLGLTTLQLGWISSLGTLAYAVGKIVLAPLADSKMGGKFIFFFSLFVSATFCFIFGFGKGLSFFVVAWSMSRLAQSMGWSGLVHVMSQWFPKKTYGTAMGFMSISYQFGGALVSLFAGVILSLDGNWRSLFFIPALTLIAIGLMIYPCLKQSPEAVGYESIHRGTESDSKSNEEDQTQYLQRFLILLSNRAFIGMLALSFILTFLRECFNIWTPLYFTSIGETASAAAFKSTIFPFLGCIGTLASGWISDRYLSGRRSPMMAVLMLALIVCLAGIGQLEQITTFAQVHLRSQLTRNDLAVIFVGAIGFFLLGSYSFVGGVVALDFGGRKVAGTAAGLLDGIGYLGATLAGVCVAELVMKKGWNHTFLLMTGCAGLGVIICFMLWNREA